MRMAIVLGVIVLAVGAVQAAGSAGALDATFDGDGLVSTELGFTENAFGVVQQPDGKLVVAGTRRHALGPDPSDEVIDWGVARYLPDGSLDASFGSGGTASPLATDEHGNAIDVTLDAAGRILLAGNQRVAITTTSAKGKKQTTTIVQRFAIVRLLANGSLDPSFGDGGVVLTEIPGATFPTANSIVALANGDILVAGEGAFVQSSGKGRDRTATESQGAILVRYDADGDLDPTFGEGGILVDDFSPDNDGVTIRGLGVQSDGRIVVAGRHGFLRRYTADGALDASFGSGGTALGGSNDVYLGGLCIDADDSILVCGYREFDPFERDGLVARFTAGGAAGWSFVTGLAGIEELRGVGVDSVGRIVAGGSLRDGATMDGYALRLTSAGVPDASFGLAGLSDLTTPNDGALDIITGSLVDANDDVVLIGSVGLEGQETDWFLARYCGS